MSLRPWLVGAVVAAGCAAACADGGPAAEDAAADRAVTEPGAPADDVELADDLTATVVASGLTGPTQLIDAPDGAGWWLAALGGPEGADRGEVLPIAADGTVGAALLAGLQTPTGIALWRDALWIATPTELVRAPLRDGRPRDPEAVLTALPNNGRSQGTLRVLDDELVFATTGGLRDGEVVEGSGRLWRLPDPDADAVELARGLKNGYALAPAGDGRIVVTEIHEPLDGTDVPPEELNVLVEGADYGWPRCVAEGTPVGEEGSCDGVTAPIALFPPRATPTSVTASPFDDTELLVALWNAGEVVAVPLDGGEPRTWLHGLDHPQHLLDDGEGGLLLVDFGGGRVLRVD